MLKCFKDSNLSGLKKHPNLTLVSFTLMSKEKEYYEWYLSLEGWRILLGRGVSD